MAMVKRNMQIIHPGELFFKKAELWIGKQPLNCWAKWLVCSSIPAGCSTLSMKRRI